MRRRGNLRLRKRREWPALEGLARVTGTTGVSQPEKSKETPLAPSLVRYAAGASMAPPL